MTKISDLDDQISFIGDWITPATESLASLYDNDRGVFWLDSEEKQSHKDDELHPTSTNRAFFALFEYLRFAQEEAQNDTGLYKSITEILTGVVRKYLTRLRRQKDQNESLKASDNPNNMFTDSVMLMSVALLERLTLVVPDLSQDYLRIRKAVKWIADWNENYLLKWSGGKVQEHEEVHDFVTLQALRGLDAYHRWDPARRYVRNSALADRVKDDILRQLAFHFSGVSSKFDPSELAFSVAVMNRFEPKDVLPITLRSIRCIVEAQAQDGGFPTARIVTKGLLHVASYEVALTLTDVLIRRLYQAKLPKGDFELCEILLPALSRVFELVCSSHTESDSSAGWANDHARRRGAVAESWVTAIVLTFLIHYRDALILFRQSLVLQRYDPIKPKTLSYIRPWPDLTSAFRDPKWINPGVLDGISDPTDNNGLIRGLREKFIDLVKHDWVQRPRNVSLILYGLPGTRKTSLSMKIAEALAWPAVILSPPDFLRQGGLEGVEASAAEIFVDLRRLRRVVILFDEMEDFFKRRFPDQKLESRTIGAFITAGMLPRLQMLRENKWIIFVLSTNSKLDDLDDAVTRLGRFDFYHEMGHPTPDAQIRYVNRKLSNIELDITTAARKKLLSMLADVLTMRSQVPDAGPLSFQILDSLITHVVASVSERIPKPEEIIGLLKNLLDEKSQRSLVGARKRRSG